MKVLAWPAFETRNPYNWLLYSALAKRGVEVHEYSRDQLLRSAYDIVHIHWPEWVFRPRRSVDSFMKASRLLTSLQLTRMRGTRVVWTVHNLQAHDSRYPRLERAFWKLYPNVVDGYVALTEDGRDAARTRFPALAGRPGFVIPIGHYRDAYVRGISSSDARASLDIAQSDRVLAFLGLIRRYKNVPHLIRVFRARRAERDILLIAGEPRSADLAGEVIEAAGDDPRVRLFLDFVPHERIQVFLTAADLVVLPFTELLNSASAMLALSFDRPILVPAKGALNELQREVGGQWVRTYPGELDAETLCEALAWVRDTPRPPAPLLNGFDWSRIAEETERAYREVRFRPGER